MKKYILTAFGKDRPGIVKAITEVLYNKNANIEDSSMSRLSDQFVIMLVFSSNEHVSAQDFSLKDIFVDIKQIEEEDVKTQPNCSALISIYGADKTGIVYKVSELLASKNVNITDLRTHKIKDLYVMLIEVELENTNLASLEKALKELSQEIKVDISLQEVCKEVL